MAVSLLEIRGTDEIALRVRVDGVETFVHLAPGGDPNAAARLFCETHNIQDPSAVNALEARLRHLEMQLSTSHLKPTGTITTTAVGQPSTSVGSRRKDDLPQQRSAFPERSGAAPGDAVKCSFESSQSSCEEQTVNRSGRSPAEQGAAESSGNFDLGDDMRRAMRRLSSTVTPDDEIAVHRRSADFPGGSTQRVLDPAADISTTNRSPPRQERVASTTLPTELLEEEHGDRSTGKSRTDFGVVPGTDPRFAGSVETAGASPAAVANASGDEAAKVGGERKQETATKAKAVGEVAAEMRARAKSSYDHSDPTSALVDIVVNGFSAPLLFTPSQRGGDAGGGLAGGAAGDNQFDREVRLAAEEWCRAFGSERAEDRGFIENEIRKAWTTKKDEMNAKVNANRTDRGSSAKRNHDDTGAEEQQKMTPTSILAPDVEKGTNVFWVQVDPTLPPLYVTAGSTALELSEKWCGRNNRGPSEIPLVAWKVLEVYPRQMEIAPKEVDLPPAGITLAYAVRQREAQGVVLLLALGYLVKRHAFRKRGSSILVPGRVCGTGRGASMPLSHRTDHRGFHSVLLQRLRTLKTHDDCTGRGQKNGSSGQTLPRGKRNLARWLVGFLAESLSWSKLWSWRENVKRFWSHVHRRCLSFDVAVEYIKDKGDITDVSGAVNSGKRQTETATLSSRARGGPSAYSNDSNISRRVPTSQVGVLPPPGTTTAEASGERHNANDAGDSSCLEAKGRRAEEVLATSAIESDAGKRQGAGDEGGGGGGDAWGGRRGEDEKRTRRTWQSALEELSSNPNYRFSQSAVIATAGRILGKTAGFQMEIHEACDWSRLMKNKKSDVIIGGDRFIVVARDDSTVVVNSKDYGEKIIGTKAKSGTIVLGLYSDLSKPEAREGADWLAKALTAAPVR